MTRDEYFKAIKEICPNCAAGIPVRCRPETGGEWVHDKHVEHGARFAHSLCVAHYFRKVHPEFSENKTHPAD